MDCNIPTVQKVLKNLKLTLKLEWTVTFLMYLLSLKRVFKNLKLTPRTERAADGRR